jgi:hypothetical protein
MDRRKHDVVPMDVFVAKTAPGKTESKTRKYISQGLNKGPICDSRLQIYSPRRFTFGPAGLNLLPG